MNTEARINCRCQCGLPVRDQLCSGEFIRPSETGVALVAALMTMVLMMVLGAALVLLSSSETMIAANFRVSEQALYAADAILERGLADLRVLPEWTDVLNGSVRSSFTDGSPAGQRTLADGTTIDLDQIANLANCAKSSACSDAEVAASTTERPWGANNPRWTAFAYGALDGLGESVESSCYGVALAGDDPSENDGDPLRDGATAGELSNPGRNLIILRARAFCPRGSMRTVEATIGRMNSSDPDAGAELRVLSWRQMP